MRFPGQQYDSAAGLNYNYFRDYDAATGRYVESDTIGLMNEPELLKRWSVLNRAGYTRAEIARPDTAEHRHWATEIALDALQGMPFYASTLAAVGDFAPGQRYRAYRSYVNVAHIHERECETVGSQEAMLEQVLHVCIPNVPGFDVSGDVLPLHDCGCSARAALCGDGCVHVDGSGHLQ